MKKDLAKAAKAFHEKPTDVDAMTAFLEQLAQENSVEDIAELLSLDYQRIAGYVFLRLLEIVPNDAELCLSVALWYYHFGLDEEAHKYLEKAKQIEPFRLPVLQTEIYLNYGQEGDVLSSLCQNALALHPEDQWLQSIKSTIEKSGRLEQMIGPPLKSKWQKLIASKAS